MSSAVLDTSSGGRVRGGGTAARRAVVRWAWRLFRREWRQQLLIVVLLAVAVGITVVGGAVATATPSKPNLATFGTANYLVSLPANDPHLAAQLAVLRRFAPIDVIETTGTQAIPGTLNTFDVRAQNPHGAYGHPMLSLVSGHYPTGANEVALTQGLASASHLAIGDVWHYRGQARRVVGLVENPQNLRDEFALVAPGTLTGPVQVNVLLDATPAQVSTAAHAFRASHLLQDATIESPTPPNAGFNPAVIVLALATFGLFFIGLVAIAGFTVMAQRRMRALGMLGAMGATDRNIRLVMIANGAVVGVVAAVIGGAAGLIAWFAYAPHLQSIAGHLVGRFDIPWWLVVTAMALAIVTAVVAAWWPARAASRTSIVTALSGRPAPPKPAHTSALRGVIALAIGLAVTAASGAQSNGSGALELVLGLVATIVGVLFLAPLAIAELARLGRRAPVAVRLALRDLSRYRARSGSALGAISVAIIIAVIVCVAATVRYANSLDYVGPNLASNQLVIYAPGYGPGGGIGGNNQSTAQLQARVSSIASNLGTHNMLPLVQANGNLVRASGGNNSSSSQPYVATPAVLQHYGINPSEIGATTDVITSRPGLAGMSDLQLLYGGPNGAGNGGGGGGGGGNVVVNPNSPGGGGGPSGPSCPLSSCLPNPTIQTFNSLPTGTSAPNLLLTMHAARLTGQNHLTPTAWLLQTAKPLTGVQVNDAKQLAAGSGMSVETRNDEPTLAQLRNWATAAGILLALGVLAMTVGLIRSETAGDLRTLAATGASSTTRRSITGVTAAGLGLLGALLGTAAGYLVLAAWFLPGVQLGQSIFANLSHVPVESLLVIIIGMPLLAGVGGWLLAGRQPPAMSRHALE